MMGLSREYFEGFVRRLHYHRRGDGVADHCTRDNAAKNILAAGLAVIACGEHLDVTGSMKQEPTGGDYAFA